MRILDILLAPAALVAERRIVGQCHQMAGRLDTLDLECKRSMFAALGLKVQATREDVSAYSGCGPQFTTTERTLECPSNWYYTVILKPWPSKWPVAGRKSGRRRTPAR